MFRQSTRRLGHQLFKEPLPNVEHGSLARGRMTHGRTMEHLRERLAFCGAGLAAAAYAVLWCNDFASATVSPAGVITIK
jgi:hypothetical protein